MFYTTLIASKDLLPHLDDPDWVLVDCRFALRDVEQGRRAYQESHIGDAWYAHLDEDLSGPIVSGKTGRHPLPSEDVFADTLSGWGIDDSVQVVAYDDASGAMAARLWWMLRWMGHDAAAVLDGGWPAWRRERLPVGDDLPQRAARRFIPRVRKDMVVDAGQILGRLGDAAWVLWDARGTDRYRGENETIDPIPGHIPGAISVPYAANLDVENRFLSSESLRARFQAHLGDVPVERSVMYCGSGVTAAHNVLAMMHAGLGEPRLYTGSWSDWITDPERPVETG